MTPTSALLLDAETTGLSVSDGAVCIEVACCLFDLNLGVPLASFSSLLHAETNEAEAINRIPAAALRATKASSDPWAHVYDLADRADVVIAHRAEFDRQFVPMSLAERTWVCSKFHVEWPRGKYGDGLVSLALAHGIGVVHAHRAMTDVDILSRLMSRVHEMGVSLPSLIERAMRPRVKVIAQVSYDDREKAKSAGFQWDGVARTWSREMFADDVAKLPFPTRAA